MISPHLPEPSQELMTISRDPHHPFSLFVTERRAEIEASLQRFGVGAIVSGGQTGVEMAAIQCAEIFGIPRFGIAPLGCINENGDIPEHIAKDMLPTERLLHRIPEDATLSEKIIAEEQSRSHWARREIFQQHLRLNALFSSATLLLPSILPLEGTAKITYEAAIRAPHNLNDVFILPLNADRLHGIGDASWWIRRQRPVFLNIAGPAESEGGVEERNVREAALIILKQIFN